MWNVVGSPDVCGRSCLNNCLSCLNHNICVECDFSIAMCVCVYARWVSGLEAVAPLLNKGLSYLLHVSKKKRKCKNFCFPPASQHKHVTGSLHPPHVLLWVRIRFKRQLFVRVCRLCAGALPPRPCICHCFSPCQIDGFCRLYRFAFCDTVRCKYAVFFEG